jgi:hypothetical protein
MLFRRALAENPDDQGVHYNLGNVLLSWDASKRAPPNSGLR